MSDASSDFYEKLITKLRKDKDRGTEICSPIETISRKFRLGPHALNLIGIVPEILCEFLKDKMDPRSAISFSYPQNMSNLGEREGVLLCHALSPFSESIGLLGDIGRGFRISMGLNKSIKIMLAGTAWTEYNWVVVDLKLKDNLPLNQTWRESLYTQLGILYDLSTIENAPETKTPDEVRVRASDYVRLSKAIWGNSILDHRLTVDEVSNYINNCKLVTPSAPDTDLLNINLFRPLLQPHKIALECILKNFFRADYGTFLYFFLQYYHQLRYKGYIKVAVARERDFDEPFRLIDNKLSPENHDIRNLAGLYFPDYEYGSIQINSVLETLTAHAYYFPSGSIYRLFHNDLKKALEHCIMISDTQEKILSRLESINPYAKARLLSDLLSFAHLLSQKNSELKREILRWMRNADPSGKYTESWNTFGGDTSAKTFSHRCNEWSFLAFTAFAHEIPIPYFFLPFIWQNEIDCNKEAELVNSILIIFRENFGTPELAISELR